MADLKNNPPKDTPPKIGINERTAIMYQIVSDQINKLKSEGVLGEDENLNVDGLMAQILLESSNGTSDLATSANNFGGIKADANWKGAKSPSGRYRAYSSMEEGLREQVNFFIQNPRYREAGVFNAKTPKEHLEAVQKGGYAEEPTYVERAMQMVNSIPIRLSKVDPSLLQKKEPEIINQELKIPENNPVLNPLSMKDLSERPLITGISSSNFIPEESAPNQIPNVNQSMQMSAPKGWFGSGNSTFDEGGNLSLPKNQQAGKALFPSNYGDKNYFESRPTEELSEFHTDQERGLLDSWRLSADLNKKIRNNEISTNYLGETTNWGEYQKFKPNAFKYKGLTNQMTFEQGGPMNQLTEFNEGGKHEQNPLGGIPQGMNPNGGMNLVEQGETKLNSKDYIYSDSLIVDGETAAKFNLPKSAIGKTFADLSKKMNRPNSRREGDTIEEAAKKRDLESLMTAQEEFKKQEVARKMAEIQSLDPTALAPQSITPMGMPPQGMVEQPPMDPSQMGLNTPHDFGGLMKNPYTQNNGLNNKDLLSSQGFRDFNAGTGAKQPINEEPSNGMNKNMMGAAIGGLGSMFANKQTVNSPTAGENAAQTAGIKSGITSAVSAVNPVIGGIIGLGQGIGNTVRTKNEQVDEYGQLKNEKKAENGYVSGHFFDPVGSMIEDVSNENLSGGQKALGVASMFLPGLSMFNKDAYSEGLERNSRKNLGITGSNVNPQLPGETTSFDKGGPIKKIKVGDEEIPAGFTKEATPEQIKQWYERELKMNPSGNTQYPSQLFVTDDWDMNSGMGKIHPYGTSQYPGVTSGGAKIDPLNWGTAKGNPLGYTTGSEDGSAGVNTFPNPNQQPSVTAEPGNVKVSNVKSKWKQNPATGTWFQDENAETDPQKLEQYNLETGSFNTTFDEGGKYFTANNPSMSMSKTGLLNSEQNPNYGYLTQTNLTEEDIYNGPIEDLNPSGDDGLTNYNETLKKLQQEQAVNQFTDINSGLDDGKSQFKYKQSLSNAAMSGIPVAYNLYQGMFGKLADTPGVNDLYTSVNSPKMNINPQLRQADQTFAQAQGAIRNAAPGAGAYLSNMQQMANSRNQAYGELYGQKENIDAQSQMKADMFNAQNKGNAVLQASTLKAQAQAAKQNYLQTGLSQLSQISKSNQANELAGIYNSMASPDFSFQYSPWVKEQINNLKKIKKK